MGSSKFEIESAYDDALARWDDDDDVNDGVPGRRMADVAVVVVERYAPPIMALAIPGYESSSSMSLFPSSDEMDEGRTLIVIAVLIDVIKDESVNIYCLLSIQCSLAYN